MPNVKYKCTRLTPITFQNEMWFFNFGTEWSNCVSSPTFSHQSRGGYYNDKPFQTSSNRGQQKWNLEIPMSHQKCFQTIGVAQPRPRVCYINDWKFENGSLDQLEKCSSPSKSGTLPTGDRSGSVDLVVFSSDYFLQGITHGSNNCNQRITGYCGIHIVNIKLFEV